MWQRFTAWFARTFGAAPGDDARLVVVFEGSPEVCRLVAMRLETEGLFVIPDPGSSSLNGFPTSLSRTSGGRGVPGPVEVAVRVTDEVRARAILDAVEPI